MRYLPILLAALVMAASPPAFSAPNDKSGSSVSSAQGNGADKADKGQKSEPPGQAEKGEAPGQRQEPPGQAKKDEPPGQSRKDEPAGRSEPPGQAKEDEPAGRAEPPGPARKDEPAGRSQPPGQAKNALVSEQEAAHRAVKQHEALPLARIVAIAGQHSSGRVINARLVRINKVLLYQLTLLDKDGRSWREYYHAPTGNPVEIP